MIKNRAVLPVILLAALAAVVHAIDFKQIETTGAKLTTECLFSVTNSTCAVPSRFANRASYGTSYVVTSSSGNATFQIKFSSSLTGSPDVFVSSNITVLSGGSVSDRFESMTINPMIVTTSVEKTGATTIYVDIGYLVPRSADGF